MNRKLGEESEKKVAKFFQKNGYWAHLFERGKNGQPVDLIAFKYGKVFLCDVKRCEKPYFVLDRVEPNQWDAMLYGKEKGADYVGIIVDCSDELFFIDIDSLVYFKNMRQNKLDILNYFSRLEEFL